MANHYETLGIARAATAPMVKAAFQAKMKALEGSGLAEAEKAATEKALRQAFVALFDPAAKSRYDKQLAPPGRGPFQSEPVAPHEVAATSPLVIAGAVAAFIAAIAAGWYVTHPSAEKQAQQRKEQARNKGARELPVMPPPKGGPNSSAK
jgi:curved DNA-binding protein CbpA